jgi:hypothetical protein
MAKPQFKIGDILQPKANRYKSNDITIRNIETIRIKSIRQRWSDDRHLTINAEVLTGDCRSYGTKLKNITVFDDAFELAKPKENYAIF